MKLFAGGRGGTPRTKPAAQRRHRRQPERKDHRGVGGGERGFDPGKKVKGRNQRHLLVDTQGLVMRVRVHAALASLIATASSH